MEFFSSHVVQFFQQKKNNEISMLYRLKKNMGVNPSMRPELGRNEIISRLLSHLTQTALKRDV